ncbi:MAG TPA: acyl-CoA thioesterase [Steroidobacteraceae bacterium]|nr:acyl-CoA thioesterase [Steroidobacteraceae bacterium]
MPFHDLDPAGIVWHGNYAKYFEIARCTLLQTFDYNYDQMLDSGYLWPVIDLRVRYVQMVRFNQRIKVTATLREWEYRLGIDYLVADAESGMRLTKGTTLQVAVDLKTRELCLMSPRILFEKLGVAVPEGATVRASAAPAAATTQSGDPAAVNVREITL